jgi:hypothetical protein
MSAHGATVPQRLKVDGVDIDTPKELDTKKKLAEEGEFVEQRRLTGNRRWETGCLNLRGRSFTRGIASANS